MDLSPTVTALVSLFLTAGLTMSSPFPQSEITSSSESESHLQAVSTQASEQTSVITFPSVTQRQSVPEYSIVSTSMSQPVSETITTTTPTASTDPLIDVASPPAETVTPTSPIDLWPCQIAKFGLYVQKGGELTWTYDHRSLPPCEDFILWELLAFFPDPHGFVIEFRDVVMNKAQKDSLAFYEFHDTLKQWSLRKTIFSNRESNPLILYSSRIRIIISLSSPKKWRKSTFNISYTPYPLRSMPAEMKTPEDEQPTESIVTYNCSGIDDLPAVILCDGLRQCERGEDEQNCSYREEGCGDWFPYGNYCLKATFRPVRQLLSGQHKPTMPLQAGEECEQLNATLANFPDSAGIEIAKKLVRNSGFVTAVIGLKKVKPVTKDLRHLYRFIWQWGGRGSPIAYEQMMIQRFGMLDDCAVIDLDSTYNVKSLTCLLPDSIPSGYICMKPKENYTPTYLQLDGVDIPSTTVPVDQFPTKKCADGSMVQAFHRCVWGQQDEEKEVYDSLWSPQGLPLFRCRYGMSVHFSLVCDGKSDCADASDEIDCVKPQFKPLKSSSFVCRNAQIVPVEQHCDGNMDCFDESDEESCVTCGDSMIMCRGIGCIDSLYINYVGTCPMLPPSKESPLYNFQPGSVYFSGGMSRLEPAVTSCSEGFFPCRGGQCIPTFLMNNEERDCPLGEDEDVPVHNTKCPGYYRCYKTGSCVHRDYVCDGVYHCPHRDDEMFCNLACPADRSCVCEGLAFQCSAMIDPLQHLQLRFLDLSGAHDVKLKNMHVMELLVLLNLSYCHLTTVVLHDMLQLQNLDLSHNVITSLTSLSLTTLPALTSLNVSFNPFVQTLDGSFTAFLALAQLQDLETLVLANVGLYNLSGNALSPLSRLKRLDLRGNPLRVIEQQSLSGLSNLQLLYADTPKLCCDYFHPSSRLVCDAPVDELSSCSDLLGQDLFRVFLWTFSLLAIVGNCGVLVYRWCAHSQKEPRASSVLVQNLCVADLLMGLYMLMIGVADTVHSGRYVEMEKKWTSSVACTVAGILSFASCEVSAFILCLITLDRVLVIGFSFKQNFHLTRHVAMVLCGGSWIIGITMASVPLLTGMDFYGQNGICVPLPITRHLFSGQTYAFSVFICLNFVLFVLIGVGQVVIYRAVQKIGAGAGVKDRQRDLALARRLFVLVATDFLCWFPIGLLGLLASGGVPVPGGVNVWIAIFVLPVNSALNPFLYTLNGVLQQWRQRKQETRVMRLLGRLQTEIPKWSPDSVHDLVTMCIRSKLVDKQALRKYLGVSADDKNGSCKLEHNDHRVLEQHPSSSGEIGVTDLSGTCVSREIDSMELALLSAVGPQQTN